MGEAQYSEEKHGCLRLSGIGHIRIRGKARTPGEPKTLDILYRQGKWYASVVFECTPEREKNTRTGAIGLDWGVETFATLAHDDGEYTAIHNECHLRNELTKLKRLQRDLSRNKRGSRNWQKSKKKLAALHSKITRASVVGVGTSHTNEDSTAKRHDFLHQTSTRIVKENSMIAVEKLNIKGMTANGGKRKKGLNREVLRAPVVGVGTSRTNGDSIATAPAAFHGMLKYLCPPGCKVEETSTRYIEVPTRKQRQPLVVYHLRMATASLKPSQTCSVCGKQEKKPLQQRSLAC